MWRGLLVVGVLGACATATSFSVSVVEHQTTVEIGYTCDGRFTLYALDPAKVWHQQFSDSPYIAQRDTADTWVNLNCDNGGLTPDGASVIIKHR